MSMRNHKKGDRLQMDSLEARVVLSTMGQPVPDYAAAPGFTSPSEINYLPSWQIGSQQQLTQAGATTPDHSWLPTTNPAAPPQYVPGSAVGTQVGSQTGLYPVSVGVGQQVTQSPSQVGSNDFNLPLTVDDNLQAIAEDLQGQQISTQIGSQAATAEMPSYINDQQLGSHNVPADMPSFINDQQLGSHDQNRPVDMPTAINSQQQVSQNQNRPVDMPTAVNNNLLVSQQQSQGADVPFISPGFSPRAGF